MKRVTTPGRSKSTLFLMELIIIIGVFALCTAVCMRGFASAKLTSDRNAALTKASAVLHAAAACYQNTAGDLDACAALLGGEAADGVCTVSFNKAWQPAAAADAQYTLTLTPENGSAVYAAARIVRADGTLLTEIPLSAYAGGR